MKHTIYVASSWRNMHQVQLVGMLNLHDFEVYDFKSPYGEMGFQWSNVDKLWKEWTMPEFKRALYSVEAQFGFNRDFDAMKSADICILCLPCGRSAHLEAGWMKAAGKKLIIFIPEGVSIEPELMYGMADKIALTYDELFYYLRILERPNILKRFIFWLKAIL